MLMVKSVKRIMATIVFLGMGMALFMGASYMLRPTTHSFRRDQVTGFYAEEKDSLNVVVLGGSGAYRFYNSMEIWNEYGFTSYDLTTPLQSTYICEYLIDEIHKTQSPDLIVVETRRFVKGGEQDVSEKWPLIVDNMNYSWNRVKVIDYLYEDIEDKVNAWFDVIKYHDNWENISMKNLAFVDNKKENALHGVKIVDRVVPMKGPVIDSNLTPEPLLEKKEKALISLMEKCRAEDIEVLFVATPWQIDEVSQRKNLYIEELVNGYGFKFFDMNQYCEEIGIDFKKDYYDTRHTNLVGSEKVSNYLGQYIVDNYELNLTHNEEVIEMWNASYEGYNIEAEEVRKTINAGESR